MLPTPPSFPFLGRVLSWINQHTQRGDPNSTGKGSTNWCYIMRERKRETERDRERLKDRERDGDRDRDTETDRKQMKDIFKYRYNNTM